jgi:hypothetical protein
VGGRGGGVRVGGGRGAARPVVVLARASYGATSEARGSHAGACEGRVRASNTRTHAHKCARGNLRTHARTHARNRTQEAQDFNSRLGRVQADQVADALSALVAYRRHLMRPPP